MKITVHSSKHVKPDYGGRGKHPSTAAAAAVVPLSVFDKVNYDEYIFYVYAFHQPVPPKAVLAASLAKTLVEYREWAGRLTMDAGGSPAAIVLNDAGARFVEATADAEFTAAALTTGTNVLSLYPTPPSCGGGGEEQELLLVQVTRFRCATVVLGFSMHHKVADGPAMWNFMVAWGQATRGVAIDPVPVHDRSLSLFARRSPSSPIKFEHRGAEFKPRGGEIPAGSGVAADEVVVHRVHFTRQWLAELKSRALHPHGGAGAPGHRRPYTTLQCVAAHLWRCITAARGLDLAGDAATTTRIRIAVNGRARMLHPAVPDGYAGTVVLWARPASTAGALLRRPLRHAAELIAGEVARIDDGYFRSFVEFASSGAVEAEGLVPTADAAEAPLRSTDVDVDCLLAIPFRELDFGCGGPPFFFRPGYGRAPADGAVYVLRSFEGDGSGVDAYVPLFRRHMEAFVRCCYDDSFPTTTAAAAMAGARL